MTKVTNLDDYSDADECLFVCVVGPGFDTTSPALVNNYNNKLHATANFGIT